METYADENFHDTVLSVCFACTYLSLATFASELWIAKTINRNVLHHAIIAYAHAGKTIAKPFSGAKNPKVALLTDTQK